MSAQATKVAITMVSTQTKAFPSIQLVTHDLHFHADLVNDRQIRLAAALASENDLELHVHPDLHDRVNRALVVRQDG